MSPRVRTRAGEFAPIHEEQTKKANIIDLGEKLLVRRAKTGDKKSLGTLLRIHEPKLRKIAESFMQGSDKTKKLGSAEDALQETFVKITDNISTFDEKSNFFTWMTTVLRNTLIDMYRKGEYRMHESLDKPIAATTKKTMISEISSRSMYGEQEENPETRVLRKMDIDIVREILEDIDEMYKEVFQLYFVEGITTREIAEKLNLKEATIKSRIRYLKEIAEKKLRAKGYKRTN
ncbi:MAG: RNA polymerase sigma factor [Candidatus Magasanikbacteria bacterium]